jgi:hypothetical protein
MTFVKRIAGAAVLIGCGLFVLPAQAAYIVTLVQQGDNVVATGSGTIDLTGLELNPICGLGCSTNAGINPIIGTIATGPVNRVPTLFYIGFTGPTSFGSGDLTLPNSGSGDSVGIDGAFEILSLPVDYVSGRVLSDTSAYNNQAFSSLGVTPGTYVWTWGSGGSADSFTLIIGAARVPEPSTLLLLWVGLVALLLVGRGRRSPPKISNRVTIQLKKRFKIAWSGKAQRLGKYPDQDDKLATAPLAVPAKAGILYESSAYSRHTGLSPQ